MALRWTQSRFFFGHSLNDWVKQLIRALLNQDSKQILDLTSTLNKQQISYQNLLHHLLLWFNHCAIVAIDKSLFAPNEQELLVQCIENWDPQIIHTFYLMVEKAQQDLDWAPNHAIGFQMLMFRILHFLHLQPNLKKKINKPIELVQKSEDVADIQIAPPPLLEIEPLPVTEPFKESSTVETNILAQSKPKKISSNEWITILNQLELDGLGKSAMQHTTVSKLEQNILHLEISENYKTLFTKTIIERVELALGKYYSLPIKIKFISLSGNHTQATPALLNAEQKIQAQSELKQQVLEHPFVQNIIQNFDGMIIENSMTKI